MAELADGYAEADVSAGPAAGDEFSVQASRNQSLFATVENAVAALEFPLSNPASEARFQQDMDRVLLDIDQAREKMLEIRASAGARLNTIDTQKIVNDDMTLQMATDFDRGALTDFSNNHRAPTDEDRCKAIVLLKYRKLTPCQFTRRI